MSVALSVGMKKAIIPAVIFWVLLWNSNAKAGLTFEETAQIRNYLQRIEIGKSLGSVDEFTEQRIEILKLALNPRRLSEVEHKYFESLYNEHLELLANEDCKNECKTLMLALGELTQSGSGSCPALNSSAPHISVSNVEKVLSSINGSPSPSETSSGRTSPAALSSKASDSSSPPSSPGNLSKLSKLQSWGELSKFFSLKENQTAQSIQALSDHQFETLENGGWPSFHTAEIEDAVLARKYSEIYQASKVSAYSAPITSAPDTYPKDEHPELPMIHPRKSLIQMMADHRGVGTNTHADVAKAYTKLDETYDVREVRGDGNCFFTSFLFSFLETATPDSMEKFISKVNEHKDRVTDRDQKDRAELLSQLLRKWKDQGIPIDQIQLEFNDRSRVAMPLIHALREMVNSEVQKRLDQSLDRTEGPLTEKITVKESIEAIHRTVENYRKKLLGINEYASDHTIMMLSLATGIPIGVITVTDRDQQSDLALKPQLFPNEYRPAKATVMLRTGHYSALIPKKNR